jgi:hypothetical protein
MRYLTLVEVKKTVHCSEYYGLTGEDLAFCDVEMASKLKALSLNSR